MCTSLSLPASLPLLASFEFFISIVKYLNAICLQETTFIEQIVEDESQMEGLPNDCSRIMNWHLHLEGGDLVYPEGWQLSGNLDAIIRLTENMHLLQGASLMAFILLFMLIFVVTFVHDKGVGESI